MSIKCTVTTREIYFNEPRGRIGIAKYLKRKAPRDGEATRALSRYYSAVMLGCLAFSFFSLLS